MAFLEKNLFVEVSTLEGAGKGLFTRIAIAKGTRILEYKGRRSNWDNAHKYDGDNGYLFVIDEDNVIDAHNYLKSLGRYANDAQGLQQVKGIKNNAQYVIEDNRVYIDALKNIPAGAEIFVGYGKEYWDTIRDNIAIDMAAGFGFHQ